MTTMVIGVTWLLRVPPHVQVRATWERHDKARLLWQQLLSRNRRTLREIARLVDVEVLGPAKVRYGQGEGVPVSFSNTWRPRQTPWREALMRVYRRQRVVPDDGETFIMPALVFQVLMALNGDHVRDGRRHGRLHPMDGPQTGTVALLLTGHETRYHVVWEAAGDSRLAVQPERWKGHTAPPMPYQQDEALAKALVALTMADARRNGAFALPHPHEAAPWLKMEDGC